MQEQEGAKRAAVVTPEENVTEKRLNAALASAIVRIHHRHVGRGPTKAQSFYRHNIIVVAMQDALTTAERTLVAEGKPDLVRSVRRELQGSMREELIEAVHLLTGRHVVAFMSDNHVDPDMAVEVFVLDAPVSAGDPPDDRRRRNGNGSPESGH
jgi:uncharacterized protein YbcI